MPAQALVMYGTPADTAIFHQRYQDEHIAMARKIPGVRGFRMSKGPINTPVGPAPYEVIVVLTFDSMDDLQAGFGSAEGQAAVAHAQEIATGGLSVYLYESEDA